MTLSDWPGRAAAQVFIGGCNFCCAYCHNPGLLSHAGDGALDTAEVMRRLKKASSWVEGLAVGGGEPCLDGPGLTGFLRQVKRDVRLPVKIDTNGTRPETLQHLLGGPEPLVAAVSLDVKVPRADYETLLAEAGDREVDPALTVERSMMLAASSDVECLFRTTVYPGYLDADKVVEIAEWVRECGGDSLVLQQYEPKNALSREARELEPFSGATLTDIAERCCSILPTALPELSGEG